MTRLNQVILLAGAACLASSLNAADPRTNDLLLRDFKPRPAVHLPEHHPERARYPVIDVHSHENDAGALAKPHKSAEQIIALMDRCNVRKLVILSGGWGEKLQRVIDEMVKPHPDRFATMVQLDWSRIDEPDFGTKMADQVADGVRRGAQGLKVTKLLGLYVRDRTGALVKVDDPRLDPVWRKCGELNVPVAIHVGDPEAFFEPLDPTNERYEQLLISPDWHFLGKDYPKHREIIDALERVFRKFPNTKFVSLHMGNWPENLDYVDDLLQRCPNVMLEFGARQAELGRQPNTVRRFFIKHQDRVMFGTDATPTEEMYRNYFRWLETEDDYFDYTYSPLHGRWKIYGLNLPDRVLKKIYYQNAEKLFPTQKL